MSDQPDSGSPQWGVTSDLSEGASFTQPFPDSRGAPGTILSQQTVQFWQGQFMPPDAIERLERLKPGTWDRMLTMAEQAQAGQIENTKQINANVAADTQRGHWLGWSVTMVAMVLAALCAWLGQPWVAGALISVTVMSVAKSLIEGSRKE